jgi:hypothetical protein
MYLQIDMPTSSSFGGRKRNTYKKIQNGTAETPLVLKKLSNIINVVVSLLKIIIIIIIIFSSFMQGIYTYIPETNRVPRQYIVAAIPSLPFMVPVYPVHYHYYYYY